MTPWGGSRACSKFIGLDLLDSTGKTARLSCVDVKTLPCKNEQGDRSVVNISWLNSAKKEHTKPGCYSVPKDSNKPPSGTSQGLAICGIVETGSNAPEDEEGQPRSNRKKRRNDKINR